PLLLIDDDEKTMMTMEAASSCTEKAIVLTVLKIHKTAPCQLQSMIPLSSSSPAPLHLQHPSEFFSTSICQWYSCTD
ncbi:hypothetical protein L9F63_028183, partial [Diploptera punctata]